MESAESSIVHDTSFTSPLQVVKLIWNLWYIFIQHLIIELFKPRLPQKGFKSHGRIAVVGAGLTGVSSAAHAISHGFEVVIYESNDKTGGIWSHVNSTSGLQLNSLLYRFHPGVLWSRAFPHRDEILKEIQRLWEEYDLPSRTRFNTPVTSIKRASLSDLDIPEDDENQKDQLDPNKMGHARWIVNDGEDGIFDAVIVTVGTCGKPKMIKFDGMPEHDTSSSSSRSPSREGKKDTKDTNTFSGSIIHSSELDSIKADDLKDKKIVVIGGGASAVEAVETALQKGCGNVSVVVRDDKWIIPRNIFIDTFLACQPFGRQMPLSFLWEGFIKRWQYKGVEDLVPPTHHIFEGTPIVNDEFLHHVRNGRCTYIRADTNRLTSKGVSVNARTRDQKPGEEGEHKEIPADIIVLATGFEKPNVAFLPDDLFPEGYQRPDLYLQNFSTEDWSILMTNSSYQNAIGTVGHFHIGIYTRILLTLLMDQNARPLPKDMKLWVDIIRYIKRGAAGGALSFFTYAELTIWLLAFHLFRPDRIRWLFFIMQGWGVYPDIEKGKSD